MNYTRLTFKQRLNIENDLRSGISQSAIARRIGVHRSTVCNELSRNGGKEWYSASRAQRKADENSKRARMPERPLVGRFPLSRGGRFCGLYVRPLKRYVRAWRYRIYVPVMRFDQKQYPFKLTWNANLLRRRYLHYRRRNHVMEGLSRAHRRLDVFKSYQKHWLNGWERGRCSMRYIRHYTLSHEGIVKLHYRNRGLSVEENDYRSVWRGHIRYEFQNPVRRRPRIGRETVSFGKSGGVPSYLRYSNRKRPSILQEDFSEVFQMAFFSVWNNAFVTALPTYVPLALTPTKVPFRMAQKFNSPKNKAQKVAVAA